MTLENDDSPDEGPFSKNEFANLLLEAVQKPSLETYVALKNRFVEFAQKYNLVPSENGGKYYHMVFYFVNISKQFSNFSKK